jgi:protein tyrosine phosphatase (PTP) superfamily phosphohydrolase (DUF442 family)
MSFLTARVVALWAFALPVFAGSVPGIKNFDRVDAHVYRGAQPTEEGFQYLAKQLGVQTIIDLREAGDRSEGEDRAVTAAGMKYVNVPMSGLTPPAAEEIARILGMLEGTTGPVFVHCRRGADRTGAVIVAYPIDHDRWDNVRALNDAMAHSMSFFQLPRQKFISSFQPRTVDVKTTVADNHGAPAFSSAAVAAAVTN